MNDNRNPANLPLGDKLRNLIQPALEDSRRQATQLAVLNDIFQELSGHFEQFLTQRFADVFNRAASKERSGGESARNMFMIEQLTDLKGTSTFLRMDLPIATAFLEFEAQDIKELPGYIALHEKARELNVALKLVNVTIDEVKSPNGPQPAMLLVDLNKSYEDGAMENSTLYPQLPEQNIPFNRTTGKGFNF